MNLVKPDVDARIAALFHESVVIDESEIQKMSRMRNEMRLALNSLLKVWILSVLNTLLPLLTNAIDAGFSSKLFVLSWT